MGYSGYSGEERSGFTSDTIMEFGRKGMIKHFKEADPRTIVPINGEYSMTITDLVEHLEANDEIGQKCVKELVVWNKDIFVDQMVSRGMGLSSNYNENSSFNSSGYYKTTEEKEHTVRTANETISILIMKAIFPTLGIIALVGLLIFGHYTLFAAVVILLYTCVLVYLYEKIKNYR